MLEPGERVRERKSKSSTREKYPRPGKGRTHENVERLGARRETERKQTASSVSGNTVTPVEAQRDVEREWDCRKSYVNDAAN